jgi:3-deoxy-D-manno-octulosonic-acid transferase
MNIPVLIVNGRVYPGDVWRYRLAHRFFRRVFTFVDWIGVQGKAEADRFKAIGAEPSQIEVVGNLKLDQVKVGRPNPDPRFSILSESESELLVAGSTHHPEEEWILDAFTNLRTRINRLRLVIAPRHVRRSGSVMQMARSRGLVATRWSAMEADSAWNVLVLDEVGVLQSVYQYAAVTVIGGSFVRHGGHNVAEALMAGSAVIVGPHVWNFSDMIGELQKSGGVIRTTRHHLSRTIGTLLLNPDSRASMVSAGLSFLRSSSGSARRYVSAIARVLGPQTPDTDPHEQPFSSERKTTSNNRIRAYDATG